MKIGDIFICKLPTKMHGVMRCVDDGKLSKGFATCVLIYTGSKGSCENFKRGIYGLHKRS